MRVTTVTGAMMTKPNQKPENGLLNILINVVIPVFILNQGSKRVGPLVALLVALAFPLVYGIWDAYSRKKVNVFSALGFINVAITGGLALAGLGGIWFCVKEAAFPFLIGSFVIVSAFGKKPFVQTLLLNPSLMDLELVEQKLQERQAQGEFHKHLKSSTVYLAGSFFFSAALNYFLAIKIFIPLDPLLDSTARSIVLNEQIAKMTSSSFAVILIPSMLVLMAILWHLLSGIKKHTGLTTEQILKS